MTKTVLCLTLLFIFTFIVRGADLKSLCGDDDWIAYEDEKCFKLFQSFATRHGAEGVCNQQGSTLVIIKSAAEQKFLIQYVFNTSIENNIWIGAERRLDSSTEFDWNDGTPVRRFTNWAVDRPSSDTRRPCVYMQSPLSRDVSEMEWVDVGCNSGQWFICEKLQPWPIERIQRLIFSTRRELQDSVDSLTKLMTEMRKDFTTQLNSITNLLSDTRNTLNAQGTQLNNNTNLLTDTRNTLNAQGIQLNSNTNLITDTRNTLNAQGTQLNSNTNLLTDTRNTLNAQGTQLNSNTNLLSETRNTLNAQGTQVQALQANPVPIGFIYVQLANQPEPRTIWGTVGWTEVTSQYAGVFFRAQGGNSAAFGSTQAESSPRLTFVNRVVTGQLWSGANIAADGTDSNAVQIGSATSTWGLTFRVSAAEVRPRNQAMRIWRRSS